MKNYIARFGHGFAKLARQAQSKEKTLAKMVAGGLTEKVGNDYAISFFTQQLWGIPPSSTSCQNISFDIMKHRRMDLQEPRFGMDLDTRVALVGPNGANKSQHS